MQYHMHTLSYKTYTPKHRDGFHSNDTVLAISRTCFTTVKEFKYSLCIKIDTLMFTLIFSFKLFLFFTFRVSRRPREMYCGHASLCVCPRPHAHAIAQTRM